MATGDESGTWGTSTNTNLELIAEAFSYGTEVITTNADTHTTTIADGATDPGRSLYLKYTGTLDSACTITIGPNTVSKVWIIENGTSGSQDIIISQGSGANITIPAGDTKVVYSDGAGAGAAFFDAFASLSVVDLKVQDDLTVTGDITGTLATAAQPNITSVGTLTALTGGTGDLNWDSNTLFVDSSANKVGIGTSSPDAPLEIDGGSTDNTVLHLTSGTANTYLKLSDSNTTNGGFIGYATEDMFLLTNNTERLRINSSGNVGIGNSAPLGKLTISNAAGANAPSTVTAANTYLQLGSDDYGPSNNGKFMIGFGFTDATNTNSPAYIGYEEVSTSGDTYGDLTFYTRSVTTDTAPTERLRIDASGNVIIGSGGLDVSGIGGTYQALNMRAGSGYPVLYGQTTATATNSVGLQLIGATSGASAGGAAEFLGIIQIAAESDSSTNAAGYMNFYTGSGGSPTERMRIDSSGNVGIGETSITARLHIKANGDTTTPCVINNTAAGAESRNQIQFQRNGTIVGSITSTASATAYNTSSDYRLKENVVTDWDATTRLKQLNPLRFNFIVDADKTVDGFLAHEVQEIVPEAITGTKDAMTAEVLYVEGDELPEGKSIGDVKTASVPDYQGIDQSKLVPLLVKTIQELEARITTLENA
jgi:hypothetical protein